MNGPPPATTDIFRIERFVDQTNMRVVEVRTKHSDDLGAMLNPSRAYYGVATVGTGDGRSMPVQFPIPAASQATLPAVFAMFDEAFAAHMAMLERRAMGQQIAAAGRVQLPQGG